MSDADILAADSHFDPRYVMPAKETPGDPLTAARRYLLDLSRAPPRRPEPGFNPHLYHAAAMGRCDGTAARDPYADFIDRGRPEGPWMLPVLGSAFDGAPSLAATQQRSALHVHAYYVDMFPRILSHLSANMIRPDLFVTVTDEAASAEAELLLAAYDGPSRVCLVPNAGRDIGPLLSSIGDALIDNYDIVGHVHTKKSVALSNDRIVEAWTRFLLENVLGGPSAGATMDRIIQAFAADPKLGIVFPSDPYVMNWTRNRPHAEGLAARLGVGPLPTYFDFPVGTMFWMRTQALRPFVELRLKLGDYPVEPVAQDGTILHALERLFGVVPVLQGYRAAVTATPGLTR
jgi:lipopolysaccharide biosynthesis protein